MAKGGRFGKYGDLKRKEKIKSAKILRTGFAKETFSASKPLPEDRPGKEHKNKGLSVEPD